MEETESDYILALHMQQLFDEECSSDMNDLLVQDKSLSDDNGSYPLKSEGSRKSKNNFDTSSMSLVDPRWELIDPLPDIRSLFLEFNEKYFWGKLSGIEVKWSPRMTLCAGLCVYEGRGGLCSVRISEPLLKLRPRKDLIETLLHEMIHAYLFVTDNNKDHDGHGPEFHKQMYRLNQTTGTNITVYHTFSDEVDNYRQHWWRCNGPCQKKPPYYGYVKRSMNRAPSHRDLWWAEHQSSCGGTYTKIKEPEGYKMKTKSSMGKKEIAKPKGVVDIRLFVGNGHQTGSDSNKLKPSSTTQSNKTEGDTILNGILRPHATVTSNVHSLVRAWSNTASTVRSKENGANVHGFGKLSKNTSDKSSDKCKVFSGTGQKLGVGSESGKGRTVGPVMRNIPGIGTVASKRYLSDPKREKMVPTEEEENVRKQLLLEKCKTKVKTSGTVIDYNSDDSEFDEFLDALLKPDFKKKKKKKKIAKPGFVSVCRKNKQSDLQKSHDRQEVIGRPLTSDLNNCKKLITSNTGLQEGSRKNGLAVWSNKKMLGVSAEATTSGPLNSRKKINSMSDKVNCTDQKEDAKELDNYSKPGRQTDTENCNTLSISSAVEKATTCSDDRLKWQPTADFAMNRNKRALTLLSSDSDSDIDENATLGSVMRRRVDSLAHPAMKRLKIDDDDDAILCSSSIDINSPHSSASSHAIDSGHQNDCNQGASFSELVNFVNCPVCQARIKDIYINDHLDSCLS